MSTDKSPWIEYKLRLPKQSEFPIEYTDGKDRQIIRDQYGPFTLIGATTHWRPLGNPPLPQLKKSLREMDFLAGENWAAGIAIPWDRESYHAGANHVRKQVREWARDYFIGNVPRELEEILGDGRDQ